MWFSLVIAVVFNTPQLEPVAQEVENTIVKMITEAVAG